MLYADRGDVYEGEWDNDRRDGRGIYFHGDGRADVCLYNNHDPVSGVRWSDDREYAITLLGEEGGKVGEEISVGEALEICGRVGVPGVPRRMFPEFK